MFDYQYGGGSTLNYADVLGIEASPFQAPMPISAGGPNQSFVAPIGGGGATGGPGPTISLLGMVALLIAWRLAVEFGSE